MKWVARIIEAALLVVYAMLYLAILSFVPKDISSWWVVPIAFGFALFFIVTMGFILSTFPEPLQKYFRNKTPDNPDGCDI